jgi:hypothetical protein
LLRVSCPRLGNQIVLCSRMLTSDPIPHLSSPAPGQHRLGKLEDANIGSHPTPELTCSWATPSGQNSNSSLSCRSPPNLAPKPGPALHQNQAQPCTKTRPSLAPTSLDADCAFHHQHPCTSIAPLQVNGLPIQLSALPSTRHPNSAPSHACTTQKWICGRWDVSCTSWPRSTLRLVALVNQRWRSRLQRMSHPRCQGWVFEPSAGGVLCKSVREDLREDDRASEHLRHTSRAAAAPMSLLTFHLFSSLFLFFTLQRPFTTTRPTACWRKAPHTARLPRKS